MILIIYIIVNTIDTRALASEPPKGARERASVYGNMRIVNKIVYRISTTF